MITAFRRSRGRLTEITDLGQSSLDQAVWIDLQNPTSDEYDAVVERFGDIFPVGAHHGEIEATSRYAEDGETVQIQLNFLGAAGVTNINVAAVLSQGKLITYHEAGLAAAIPFRQRAEQRPSDVGDGASVLLGLIEEEVDHLADVLERTYVRLERLSHHVLADRNLKLEEALVELADIEGRNGQIRLNLMDGQRVLMSCSRSRSLGDASNRLGEILRDVDSLFTHSAFLLEEITFLSGTVMGLIGNEQNQIMKVLSIVAVVFLPPTLVASIYGMNFLDMPELSWQAGYPLALAIMVLLGVAPYWYAKRKGWL